MPSYRDDQYDQDIAIGVLQAGLVEVYAWLDTERGKVGLDAPDMLSRAYFRMLEAQGCAFGENTSDQALPQKSVQRPPQVARY